MEETVMKKLTPEFYEKDLVRVEWVQLGEGWSGDYDETNPDDQELLRFDVMRQRKTGETTDEGYLVDRDGFVTMHDASYCTAFPVATTDQQKMDALAIIMARVYEPVMSDQSVKKICEELSWIDPTWLKKESNEQNQHV